MPIHCVCTRSSMVLNPIVKFIFIKFIIFKFLVLKWVRVVLIDLSLKINPKRQVYLESVRVFEGTVIFWNLNAPDVYGNV